MNIIIFLSRLSGGGAERNLCNYANMLSPHFRVKLVVARAGGELKFSFSPDVEIIELKQDRLVKAVRKLLKIIKSTENLHSVITTQHFAGNAVLWCKLLSSKKTRYYFREAISPIEAYHYGTKKTRLHISIAKVLFRYYDKIISVSEDMSLELEKFYKVRPSKICTVKNPVITKEYLEWLKKDEEDLYQGFDGKRITAVGRVAPQKDYTTLIKAINSTKDELGSFKVYILGEIKDANYYEGIKGLIKELDLVDNFIFLGFVTNPMAYVKQSDLYVLCSTYEGLPNSLIQALGTGTPVVSTNCKTGPREILKDGAIAKLTEVGDYLSLGKAILNTLNEEKEGQKEKRIARAHDYSEENSLKDLLNCLKVNQIEKEN